MNPWPIAQLIPHSGNAILIDEIVSFEGQTLVARTRIKPEGLFHNADGSLPAWVGLEIMAQAVAAWAGCQALSKGLPINLGFLLGTRHYQCQVPAFTVGTDLMVSVTCTLQDEAGIGSFACEISETGQVLASARVNAYSPGNVNHYTQEAAPLT